MIATCPYCQSGFYISPELAGNVINCSKCKKQVRAPDRRARGLTGEPPPGDGIPIAIVAETRAEVEERLKNETESKHEVEQRLKQEQHTLSELQEQLAKETQARKKAEAAAQAFAAKLKDNRIDVSQSDIASLKADDSQTENKLQEATDAGTRAETQTQAEVKAKTELESRLSVETEARKKAEEALGAEKQGKAELEKKLKAETEAKTRAEALIGKEGQDISRVQAKLQEAQTAAAQAGVRAESESHAKMQIEKQLQEEKDARVRMEGQWKMEVMAKRKIQAQLELDAKAREKAEAEITELKARIKEMGMVASKRKSVNQSKRLFWLTFVFSIILAGAAGYFAYVNGYIINSHFDRPVHLPMFDKPVYLPVNLVAISVGGFLAAWVIFLVQLVITKGFQKPPSMQKKQDTREPRVEEIMTYSEKKLWRSS